MDSLGVLSTSDVGVRIGTVTSSGGNGGRGAAIAATARHVDELDVLGFAWVVSVQGIPHARTDLHRSSSGRSFA